MIAKTMPIILIKFKIIFVFLFFTTLLAKSQDAPMSQYYSNLVVLNPAFAGTTGGDRVNLFYRNQWLRTNAGFHSFGAAYDKRFSKYNSGIGVILTNEINGAYIAPTIDFAYSYMVQLTPKLFVSMALQGGITQKYLQGSSLIFEEQEFISPGFSKIIPDFSAGFVAFYKNMYGGFSIDHIAQPYQGVSKSADERINRKYTAFVGYLKYYKGRLLNQQRILSPNLLVQIQGLQQNINWGFSFQYDNLVGGLWIRNNFKANFDAMIFSAGYKTQDYKFAYSYDMNLGKKTTVPLGAHEVSFTVLFETKAKKKHKSINCPTFLE